MSTGINVGTREEWRSARLALLEAEKELTRRGDELSRQRRALPWVAVETAYEFETPSGPASLADLFAGRSQLLVYHFMFGPDWDEGCPSCSFWADGFNGIQSHLAHRDTSFVVVSRGPLDKLMNYQGRMGWSFPWVSSGPSDFNRDFHVSFEPSTIADGEEYNFVPIAEEGYEVGEQSDERPGLSAFAMEEDGRIFHTYSCYARGLEMFNGAYSLLDLTPKGRDEDELPWSMAWLRRHDEYDG